MDMSHTASSCGAGSTASALCAWGVRAATRREEEHAPGAGVEVVGRGGDGAPLGSGGLLLFAGARVLAAGGERKTEEEDPRGTKVSRRGSLHRKRSYALLADRIKPPCGTGARR